MKKFVTGLGLLLLSVGVWGQNEDDALRYSMTYFGGTARNVGMAGTMAAFGGDFSVVAQNPAGLARIRKSNFSTTLNIESPGSTADFLGTENSSRGSAGNLSNLSYVKAYELDPDKFNNWYGVQLGMGMTRINSFHQRINYTGTADSSILHSFIRDAAGTPDSLIYDAFPFGAGLAYDVFAIDPAPDNQYVTDFTSGNAIHDRTITRKGGMNEFSFSLSGNYANKLYLGGTFNAIRVKYSDNFRHRETYTDTSLWLRSIDYTGTLDIEGWGYNLRIGAIFLPVDWVSVGVSAQLPTAFNLSDSWSNNMTADTDDGGKFVDPAFVPTGSYDYKLRTPFRANGSLGIVLEQFGSIGAEVEFVDYSSAFLSSPRFSSAPYSFAAENAQIENIYRSVLNYKIGAEARVNSQAYLRGGFALYASPFKEGKGNANYPTLFYTGGAGYNWGDVYVDGALVLQQKKFDYFAYDPTINGSNATIDQRNFQVMFSLGLRLN